MRQKRLLTTNLQNPYDPFKLSHHISPFATLYKAIACLL